MHAFATKKTCSLARSGRSPGEARHGGVDHADSLSSANPELILSPRSTSAERWRVILQACSGEESCLGRYGVARAKGELEDRRHSSKFGRATVGSVGSAPPLNQGVAKRHEERVFPRVGKVVGAGLKSRWTFFAQTRLCLCHHAESDPWGQDQQTS